MPRVEQTLEFHVRKLSICQEAKWAFGFTRLLLRRSFNFARGFSRPWNSITLESVVILGRAHSFSHTNCNYRFGTAIGTAMKPRASLRRDRRHLSRTLPSSRELRGSQTTSALSPTTPKPTSPAANLAAHKQNTEHTIQNLDTSCTSVSSQTQP